MLKNKLSVFWHELYSSLSLAWTKEAWTLASRAPLELFLKREEWGLKQSKNTDISFTIFK